MAHGDYQFWQSHYQRLVADVDANTSPALTPRSANYQIFIQKISNAGNSGTITITDDDPGGDVIIAVVLPNDEIDFGPTGTPVRVGNPVDITGTFTGRVHVEAYEKLAVATDYKIA